MTKTKSCLQSIQTLILNTKITFNREMDDILLLAVSKTWPAEKLRELAEQGQRLFGENHLQEALQKIDALADLDIEWHFIGPVQSNKTKEIARHFTWVQSVDRFKIARRLNEQRPADVPPLNICIQVNLDNETGKSGVSADEIMSLAEKINELERLKLRGLMVIPARQTHESAQRERFHFARSLFKQLQQRYPQTDTLSMGMSGDMQAAIAEGSTMLRIGTALLGARNT